jgi:mRNA-degrading endonuclease RelE of RelBE toxin-antitoxin system
MWNLERRNKFLKQFSRLDKNTRKRVLEAISELATAENPALLGKYKPSLRIFSYEIGRTHRIIYNVRWNDSVIELLRVCDHKSAYGKD